MLNIITMGYSHYWNRPMVLGTKEQFEKFSFDCKKIFDYCENELGIKLADGRATKGSYPVANNNEVWFNGSNEQPLGTWTTYEDIIIPWPSPNASIVESEEPIAGEWFGGTLVSKRIAPCENLSTVAQGSYETVHIRRCIPGDGLQLDKYINDNLFFYACKTAYRPYDLTVTAVLVALKHHFPVCVISSNGVEKDWLDARILCNNILGYGLNVEILI
jgi:hypothetical protein